MKIDYKLGHKNKSWISKIEILQLFSYMVKLKLHLITMWSIEDC